MTADRSMDAQIAERCFGWKPHPQPKDYDGKHGDEPILLPPGVTLQQQLNGGLQLPPQGKLHIAFFVPPYTEGWRGALRLLDDIHSFWVFSRRSRFYRALADQCVIDARPAFAKVSDEQMQALQNTRVAWPDALGIFRENMPEFICRAALNVGMESESVPTGLRAGGTDG